MLDAEDGSEEPTSLVEAEDGREPLGLLGTTDADHDALSVERDLVEEPEGGDGLVEDAPRDLLLANEMEEECADLLGTQRFGRAAEVASEGGHPRGVDLNRPGGEVPQFHVLDHSPTQRRHGVLPVERCACPISRFRHRQENDRFVDDRPPTQLDPISLDFRRKESQ